MFACLTVLVYLAVGTVAVRVFAPEVTSIEFPSAYFNLFSDTKIETALIPEIDAPNLNFARIVFPEMRSHSVFRKEQIKNRNSFVEPVIKQTDRASYELPFHEPVTLTQVEMKTVKPLKLASLYKEFKFEVIAQVIEEHDAVSTQMGAISESKLFEHQEPKDQKSISVSAASETTENIAEVTNPQTDLNVDNHPIATTEEVAVEELIAFDYSKAMSDIKMESVPTLGNMTTQNVASPFSVPKVPPMKIISEPKSSNKSVTTQLPQNEVKTPSQNDGDKHHKGFVNAAAAENKVTIQITGSNLRETGDEQGFEVRFNDDQSEILEDHNTGYVSMSHKLASSKMTRAATVLKRGYAPTNTDIILEEGATEMTLPLITEEKFNQLLAPYEARGSIGNVLVELEGEVQEAILDVPYSQVLFLDENMKETEGKDFSYQLFVGVKAGNALLGYKDKSGNVTTKIIHVHERELTFETNFFENVENDNAVLLEEDLMSKEKMPLIISSEEVIHFATDKKASKMTNHMFRTNFDKILLGGRRYLELTHQSEPVFVGFRDNTKLEVPSENLMRHVLSRFQGPSLVNRCLVQINMKKKPLRVDVGSESAGDSLSTNVKVLDADGKFYDSVGPKSNKIFILGETHGSSEYLMDSKINIKVSYQDGSVDFVGSYCSPNSYLVEQL